MFLRKSARLLVLMILAGLLLFLYVGLPNFLGMVLKNAFQEGTNCDVSLSRPRIDYLERTASVSDVSIHCEGESKEEGFYASRVSAKIKLRELLDQRVIVNHLLIEGAKVKSLNWDSAFIRTIAFVLKKPEKGLNKWKGWVPVITINTQDQGTEVFQFGNSTASIVANNVSFRAIDPIDRFDTAVTMEAIAHSAKLRIKGQEDRLLGDLAAVAEAKLGKIRFTKVNFIRLNKELPLHTKISGYIDVRTDEFFLDFASKFNGPALDQLMGLGFKGLSGDFILQAELRGPITDSHINLDLKGEDVGLTIKDNQSQIKGCSKHPLIAKLQINPKGVLIDSLELKEVFSLSEARLNFEPHYSFSHGKHFEVELSNLANFLCRELKNDISAPIKGHLNLDLLTERKLQGKLELHDFDVTALAGVDFLKKGTHRADLKIDILGTTDDPSLEGDMVITSVLNEKKDKSKIEIKYTNQSLSLTGFLFTEENTLKYLRSAANDNLVLGLNLRSFPATYFLSAEIDSRVTVVAEAELTSDSLDHSELKGMLKILSVDFKPAYKEFHPPDPVLIRLQDGFFKVADAEFNFFDLNVKVDGDLAKNEDLNLKARVTGEIPDVLASLLGVESLLGNVYANIEVKGGFEDPVIDGKLEISDGVLTFAGIEGVMGIEGISALLTFDDSEIEIKKFSGNFGDGEVKLYGKVQSFLNDELRNGQLALIGENVLIEPIGGLEMRVDTALAFNFLPHSNPVLQGEIVIAEASYQRQFSIQTIVKKLKEFIVGKNEIAERSRERGPKESNVELDIQVRTLQGLYVDTTVMQAELEGDLRIKGTIDEPLVAGGIELVSGQFRINQTNFEILAGSMKFDGSSYLNPLISLSSEGDLRKRSGETEKIYLNISGPLNATRVSFASDGASSPQEVVRQLGVGTGGSQINLVETDRRNIGFREVISPSSDLSLSERFAGLTGFDQVRIETAVSTRTGDFVPQVLASRPLAFDLRSTIWAEVAGDRASGARLEHSLRENLSVFTGWRSQSVLQPSSTNSSNFSVGLKFKESFKGISFFEDREKVSE